MCRNPCALSPCTVTVSTQAQAAAEARRRSYAALSPSLLCAQSQVTVHFLSLEHNKPCSSLFAMYNSTQDGPLVISIDLGAHSSEFILPRFGYTTNEHAIRWKGAVGICLLDFGPPKIKTVSSWPSAGTELKIPSVRWQHSEVSRYRIMTSADAAFSLAGRVL